MNEQLQRLAGGGGPTTVRIDNKEKWMKNNEDGWSAFNVRGRVRCRYEGPVKVCGFRDYTEVREEIHDAYRHI